MAFPTAVAREATSPAETFGFALEGSDVIRKFWVLRPWSMGLLVTLIQLFVAVFLLAPEGPFSFRYQSLVQHDGYWFVNILERGYQTTIPPINHKVMEVSNVAFFFLPIPRWPRWCARFFASKPKTALLIAAQLAAWGFWTYFFLFCERWKLSPTLRLLGTFAIVAHPAAFFLIAGYSESLFLMGACWFHLLERR